MIVLSSSPPATLSPPDVEHIGPMAESSAAPASNSHSFVQRLLASNFDLPSVAAALPPDQLLTLIADPAVQSELEHLLRFHTLCLSLRQAHYRSIAMARLASLLDSAPDPIEKRRAATTLLRSDLPLPEGGSRGKGSSPLFYSQLTQSTSVPVPDLNSAPAHTPLSIDDSSSSLVAHRSPLPAPPPLIDTSSPSAADLVANIRDALAHNDDPEQDAGLATLVEHLSDDARLDGEPLPTADPDECVETLAESRLVLCTSSCNGSARTGDPPACSDPDSAGNPTRAVCTLPYVVRTLEKRLNAIFTLTRSDGSAGSARWLISSIDIAPTPNTS